MTQLIARLQIELDTKQRLLQTERRDYIAVSMLQRIDREINKIQRLIDEKRNTKSMSHNTDRALPHTETSCAQYRADSNGYYNTILTLLEEQTLCTEGATQ